MPNCIDLIRPNCIMFLYNFLCWNFFWKVCIKRSFHKMSITIYIQPARVFRPSFRRIVALILVIHLLCWNFLEKVFVKRSSPKMSITINTVSTWNISQSVYNNQSSRHFFKLSFRLSLVRYFYSFTYNYWNFFFKNPFSKCL